MQETSISSNIAKHMYEVFYGGNWTTTNFKDVLSDVKVEEAIKKVDGFNTILGLSYHIYYFVREVNKVLGGAELEAHDKFSFDHPEISTEEEWSLFQKEVLETVLTMRERVEKIEDHKLTEDFIDPKYGNLFRNLIGIVEHSHYHLGQIVIIKKTLRSL